MKKLPTNNKRPARWRVRMVVIALAGVALLLVTLRAKRPSPKEVEFDTEPNEMASQPTQPFHNEAGEANKRGYAWAQTQVTVSHAHCKTQSQRNQWAGCSKFVTEQKHIPPTPTETELLMFPTAAACSDRVQVYYDTLFGDMLEQGLHHAVAVNRRRHMARDLQTCSQIDVVRSLTVIYEPTQRLKALIEKVERGHTLTMEEVQSVGREYVRVEGFMADAGRDRYLQMAEQLFKTAGGKARFVAATPIMKEADGPRCDDLRAQIERHKLAYHKASAQGGNGSQAGPEALREQQDHLDAWSTLAGQSQALGCPKAVH